jgi:hypothetical protein
MRKTIVIGFIAVLAAATFVAAAYADNLAPASSTIKKGAPLGGDNGSLGKNDGDYLVIEATHTGKHVASFYGEYSLPQGAHIDGVTFRGMSSMQCTHKLAAWNWNAKSWDTMDQRPLGTTETQIDTVLPGSQTTYVKNRMVRILGQCQKTTTAHQYSTDQLVIKYTP